MNKLTETKTAVATARRAVAVAVDTVLLPAFSEIRGLEGRAHHNQNEADKLEARTGRRLDTDYVARLRAEAETMLAAAALLREAVAPLSTLAAAGQWDRFNYVPAGHVHRSYCSTLRPTTEIYSLPEYSGATPAEVIEAAGEVACTVCFPGAPVTARPSTIRYAVEEREAREAEAAERASKRQAAASAAIVDERGRVAFKTRRGAENELGQVLGTLAYYVSYHAELFDGRDHFPNPVSLEEYTTGEREARLYAPERRKARALMALLEANGIPAEEVAATAAKKWAAKVKEAAKNGAVIPEGFTY